MKTKCPTCSREYRLSADGEQWLNLLGEPTNEVELKSKGKQPHMVVAVGVCVCDTPVYVSVHTSAGEFYFRRAL